MCNSSLINISRVSLSPCQLLKVDLGQPIQILDLGQLSPNEWLSVGLGATKFLY